MFGRSHDIVPAASPWVVHLDHQFGQRFVAAVMQRPAAYLAADAPQRRRGWPIVDTDDGEISAGLASPLAVIEQAMERRPPVDCLTGSAARWARQGEEAALATSVVTVGVMAETPPTCFRPRMHNNSLAAASCIQATPFEKSMTCSFRPWAVIS